MAFRLTLALLITAGCGLGTATARCELRPGKAQCTDIRNALPPTILSLKTLCGTLSTAIADAGVFTDGQACDTSGSVGGCQAIQGDGSKQTNWYFAPKTTADAQMECGNSAKFVTP